MNEDFSFGKMSADARLTATFKYYEKTEPVSYTHLTLPTTSRV